MPEYNLRPYQIENLGVAIKMKKHLDLSHPGTGKSGTASMLAYYTWAREQKKTWYVMPQSLLRNNRTKMLQFTDFAPEDVEILTSDQAPLTKKWKGLTKVHSRRVRSLKLRVLASTAEGVKTNALTHERAVAEHHVILREEAFGPPIQGETAVIVFTHDGEIVQADEVPKTGVVVCAHIPGPDGEPQVQKGYTEPVVVKDLIANCNAKVIITTFAFLREHWEHMLKCHPDIDLLMLDEAHLGIKRPGSATVDAMWHVNRHVSRFYPMTGSLPDGQLDSLFPIIHAIEPIYYGSHEGFLNKHAAYIDDYGRVQGWVQTEDLKSILKRHSTCRTFTECYGEEPVVFIHELVEVGPKARAEYDKFHKEAMLELEDGDIIDGTLPGVAVIRARQILAHPETMGIAKGEVTGKDERLKIFANEGQKLVVFAALKPEQRRCKELLEAEGLRVGLINSDVPKKDRDKVDLAFRDGRLDAVVASAPTAGVGYDWEVADHMVNVSVDYQDVNFLQAYRRGSRGTRTTTLRVTSLEYEDTIDRRLYDILAEKSALANRVDDTRTVLSFTG